MTSKYFAPPPNADSESDEESVFSHLRVRAPEPQRTKLATGAAATTTAPARVAAASGRDRARATDSDSDDDGPFADVARELGLDKTPPRHKRAASSASGDTSEDEDEIPRKKARAAPAKRAAPPSSSSESDSSDSDDSSSGDSSDDDEGADTEKEDEHESESESEHEREDAPAVAAVANNAVAVNEDVSDSDDAAGEDSDEDAALPVISTQQHEAWACAMRHLDAHHAALAAWTQLHPRSAPLHAAWRALVPQGTTLFPELRAALIDYSAMRSPSPNALSRRLERLYFATQDDVDNSDHACYWCSVSKNGADPRLEEPREVAEFWRDAAARAKDGAHGTFPKPRLTEGERSCVLDQFLGPLLELLFDIRDELNFEDDGAPRSAARRALSRIDAKLRRIESRLRTADAAFAKATIE